ncbi:TPA: hypothetical protein ACG0AV_002086 [Elizabethkingia anophelis]
MRYEVTKEQILEAHADACNEWKEKLEEWFPTVFEQKCEVGKWYWASEEARRNKTFLFYYSGNEFTYGWGYNKLWSKTLRIGRFPFGIEATNEDLRDVFAKEVIERYGENWNSVKVKECMDNKASTLVNAGVFLPVLNTYNTIQIWSSNGCLYKDGKWADMNVELLPRLPKEPVKVSKSDIAKLMNVEVTNLKIVD